MGYANSEYDIVNDMWQIFFVVYDLKLKSKQISELC